MSTTGLSVGIDFGTTKSVIAWWDSATAQAFCINEEPTPSLVYFHRDGAVLIGKEVQEILEDRQHLQSEEYEGFALSIKRHLNAGLYWYVNGRKKTEVDVVAAILGRLKEDAEDRLHQKITRAVITHPSKFEPAKEKIIRTAALKVGFKDVELLSEPEAAAIAYQRIERSQSQHILIFDFGGGTCNVAALTRQPDQQFKVISHQCLEQCGGDDLDEALYDYSDKECLRLKGRHMSPKEQTRDLRILRHCKVLKESLSDSRTKTFSSLLYSADGSSMIFEYTLKQAIFEDCIRKYIERTIQATQEVINEARLQGCEIEAVVMLGGSSKIPLVKSSLTKALDGLTMLRKDYRKLQAVAIGAAYHAALPAQQSFPSGGSPDRGGSLSRPATSSQAPAVAEDPIPPLVPPVTPKRTLEHTGQRWRPAFVIVSLLICSFCAWWIILDNSSGQHIFSTWLVVDGPTGSSLYGFSFYPILFGLLLTVTVFVAAIAGFWTSLLIGLICICIDLLSGAGLRDWPLVLDIVLIVLFISLARRNKTSRPYGTLHPNSYAVWISSIGLLVCLGFVSVSEIWIKGIPARDESIYFVFSTIIYILLNLIFLPILLLSYKTLIKSGKKNITNG